ncbi:MAG: histidinol-phosphatase, partial [Selenomonadaceae bacterium]|nr:histidinol-phosphatase [Selenomonadaceae bacterium]
EIDYANFKDDIDKVLKIIIDRDKVLELNTRRLNTRRGLKELVPIYSQYKKLGGKYVTIGSDAHKVEAVGNYFDLAVDFAHELDLIIVTFCNRKLEICK